MKLFKNILILISTLTLPFSAFAVDKNFPNDKVTMWGDFSGITLDVKLIGGAPYDPLYQEMIPVWEEKFDLKIFNPPKAPLKIKSPMDILKVIQLFL